MKFYASLSGDTMRRLEEMADLDGVEPAKRVHQYLRKFLFESGAVPGAISLAAQISALEMRRRLRVGERTLTADEVAAAAARYGFPAEPPEAPKDTVEVVVGRRIEELLPKVLAYLDAQSSSELRRSREWEDLPGFVGVLVTGRVAEESSKNDARGAEEEEQALYPTSKRGAA